jgi:hypothetical protein
VPGHKFCHWAAAVSSAPRIMGYRAPASQPLLTLCASLTPFAARPTSPHISSCHGSLLGASSAYTGVKL